MWIVACDCDCGKGRGGAIGRHRSLDDARQQVSDHHQESKRRARVAVGFPEGESLRICGPMGTMILAPKANQVLDRCCYPTLLEI